MRYSFLFIILLTIFSCRQNNPQRPTAYLLNDTILSPVVIEVTIPLVTRLDTCLPPRTIAIPEKPGGSYIIETETGPKAIQLLPPESKAADFFVLMKNFSTTDGLTLNTIISSFRDKKGNLWFGTAGSGVSRYDGKSFTNYSAEQGLASNYVSGMLEDKSGNLWFAT